MQSYFPILWQTFMIGMNSKSPTLNFSTHFEHPWTNLAIDLDGSIQPNSSIDDSHNNRLNQTESECKNVIASAGIGTEGNILIFPPSVMKQEIGQQEDNSQMEVSEVAEISHQLNQSSFVSTETSNSHMPPPPMTPKSSRSQMRNKMVKIGN